MLQLTGRKVLGKSLEQTVAMVESGFAARDLRA
jgi:hypothetical protein